MFRAVLFRRIREKTRRQKFFINFSVAAKGAVLKWLLLFIRMVSGAERDRKLSYDSPTGGIIFCAATTRAGLSRICFLYIFFVLLYALRNSMILYK